MHRDSVSRPSYLWGGGGDANTEGVRASRGFRGTPEKILKSRVSEM